MHSAVNKQVMRHISYSLGESSDDPSLCKIIELSAKENGVLEERTLTEIPFIKWCRMVRVASKLVPWGVLLMDTR